MRVYIQCQRGGSILFSATVSSGLAKHHPSMLALLDQIAEAVLGEIEIQKTLVKKAGDSSFADRITVQVTCYG